ncbi:glycosyltransferase [Azospirillum sp. ST 5-10]|uniref:glycosyltransferase n=1 Tax=unclassified Azospirillum TaxID=2630922 RepID=UPI003F49C0BD
MGSPTSVTVFATNDPKAYSGGRYHALIMAYALAAAGCRVTVVTDHVPAFDRDLAPLAPSGVRYVVAPDFRSGVEAEPQDWVVLVPTGIFLPDFYAAAADHCAAAGARMVLLNFESANWFNALSPCPRDARLWDAWRRSCLDGALVLSSTRESLAHARAFYRSPYASVRHDVWYPPINSPLAESFDGLEKQDLVVAFVRPGDAHKGGRDLLGLDPAVLAGQRLVLVAGRDVDPAYLLQVRKHFGAVPGCRPEVMTRISDAEKLRLLTRARLLLFPTHFEGYGYPPIEAAYCGTPTAGYDLPVLRETVGAVAGLAPVGDTAALSREAARLLAEPPLPAALRAAVRRFAHFGQRAEALAELLLRHGAVVRPRAARPLRCVAGPFAGTPPRLAGPADRGPLPEFPCHVTALGPTAEGRVALSGMVATVAAADAVEVRLPGDRVVGGLLRPVDAGPQGGTYRFHALLPLAPGVAEVTCRVLAGDAPVLEQAFRLTVPEETPAPLPTVHGTSQRERDGEGAAVRGWVLAHRQPDEVAASADGRRWSIAAVTGERRDLAGRHPGYGGYRAEFRLRLPTAEVPAGGLALLLLANGHVVGGIDGWLGEAAAPAAAAAGATVTPAAAEPPPPPVRLEVKNLNDAYWTRGISRFGSVQTPSAFVTEGGEACLGLAPGTVLRFPHSGLRRVVKTERRAPVVNVYVDRPLNPFLDGAPAAVEVVPPRAGGDLPSRFAMAERSGDGWLRGVTLERGDRHRRGFFLPAGEPASAALRPGTVLRFAASGERTVVAAEEAEGGRVLWLDGPIGPVGDGAPRPVEIVRVPAADEALLFPEARDGGGWRRGILRDPAGRRHGLLVATAACPDRLAPGACIDFPGSGPRRVVAVERAGAATAVLVDGALDPARDGHPGWARLLGEEDGVPVRPLFPVPAFPAADPLYLALVRQARGAARALPAAPPAPRGDRPRVLFLTLVPPFPATQGNRVVTRNLIAHLVGLGYDVDCVLQGQADVRETVDAFGGRVRIVQVPFPNWEGSAEVRARAKAAGELGRALSPVNAFVAEGLNRYHPFFIVRDETVEAAKALVRTHTYASVVCNYHHMVRVVKELEPFVALPPVCIVTHDALSRLPLRLGDVAFDSMYRACPPELEREALDAVPGAVVAAISEDEERHFRAIGVRNPIVLCEYDGCEEMARHAVGEDAFARRTLLYHASANPMNVAGLLWFIDNCWLDVAAAVPDARLLVCGRVCQAVTPDLPGVELYGEVEREDLYALARGASVAVNPCVAGTGLKIKTVEAVCLGLPSVCLPPAVDGLRDDADRFAITADGPAAFAAACVTLLSDEKRWRALHRGARQLATTRFHGAAVYRALDAAMGWRALPADPAPAPGDGAPDHGVGDHDAPDHDPLDETPRDRALAADPAGLFQARRDSPDDPAVLAALGSAMAQAGEPEIGRQLVERAAGLAPERAHYARLAARLALAGADPWLALLHAARIAAGPHVASAEGYRLCGEALVARNQLEEAAKALWQAVALDPGHRGALAALAACCDRLGRQAEAHWCRRRLGRPYRFGETLRFAEGGTGVGCLGAGWSHPEAWGTWSADGEASLVLDLAGPPAGDLAEAPAGDLEVIVEGQGFVAERHPAVTVEVLANGTAVARWTLRLGAADGEWRAPCPRALLDGRRRLHLAFRIRTPCSPAALGLGDDTRPLGLGLRALRIEAPAPAPSARTGTRVAVPA